MIKNLNQLRRTLREGTQLEILDHCRPPLPLLADASG